MFVHLMYVSIKIYSSMKIHDVNIAYFIQQIIRCFDQLNTFNKRINAWLLDEKSVNYKTSDMNFH